MANSFSEHWLGRPADPNNVVVRQGAYGPKDSLTPNYQPADEALYLQGSQYGSNGTEFTGQLNPTIPVSNCPPTRDSIYATVSSTKAETVICSEDITTKTLEIVFETLYDQTDVAVIDDANITKSFNEVSFSLPAAVTATERTLQYTVRDVTTKQAYAEGQAYIEYAALIDGTPPPEFTAVIDDQGRTVVDSEGNIVIVA